MKYNQLGRFDISQELIRKNPDEVAKIFSGMIVLKVVSDLSTDTATYTAICDGFLSVAEHHQIPFYACTVESKDGKYHSHKWTIWQ